MTKSETLKFLELHGQYFKVLPQISFSIAEFNSGKVMEDIETNEMCNSKVIIRSSALDEDINSKSNAGKYTSLLNISGKDNILGGVKEVIKDMQKSSSENHQIFIQPFLEEVKASGVIFSFDPNTLSPYYVINYDDESGLTDTVTSGRGNTLKTYYSLRSMKTSDVVWIQKLIVAVSEVEGLLKDECLDIEFAIDKNDEVYILQARKLILNGELISLESIQPALDRIEAKIRDNNIVKPYLYGKRTIYGIMPDWNPAEIIGVRPRPLALSLYKRLITDGTWAYQRNNYGYKNLRSFPLLIDFQGLPFIDTRVSFNSFIPKIVDESLSEKLVNYYLDQLEMNPEKHDKIEFDIVYSCFTLDLDDRINVLLDFGFTKSEISTLRDALLELTSNIIDNKNGLWKFDVKKIEVLENKYDEIVRSELGTIDKIYWMLEDCIRYGTLPFAGLARAGFIAIQILQSFVNKGIISKDEYDQYLRSLNTISTSITVDRKNLGKKDFLLKYGHLRPGTYDILSPRYDQDYERYFGSIENFDEDGNTDLLFKITFDQMKQIRFYLEEFHFNKDVIELFDFLKGAIEGREYSKFVFTKSLSYILELMAELGNEYGISREDMSYCNISVINRLYSSSDSPEEVIRASISEERMKYNLCCHICLPPVIFNSNQVKSFHMPDNHPNFITRYDIFAEVTTLEDSSNISGKIVLIKSADPGFDWIFSHNIKGFITAYGGVNSHMAIRSSELGLPAVIGVGEIEYEKLKKSKLIRLDCLNRKIHVLDER